MPARGISVIVRYTYTPRGIFVFADHRVSVSDWWADADHVWADYEGVAGLWGHCPAEGERETCWGPCKMFVWSQCGEGTGAAGLHHQHRCKFDLFTTQCAALCNHYHNRETMKGKLFIVFWGNFSASWLTILLFLSLVWCSSPLQSSLSSSSDQQSANSQSDSSSSAEVVSHNNNDPYLKTIPVFFCHVLAYSFQLTVYIVYYNSPK